MHFIGTLKLIKFIGSKIQLIIKYFINSHVFLVFLLKRIQIFISYNFFYFQVLKTTFDIFLNYLDDAKHCYCLRKYVELETSRVSYLRICNSM